LYVAGSLPVWTLERAHAVLVGVSSSDIAPNGLSAFWQRVREAKTVGLTIPQSLLLRADEVMQ
jgi:hypothetical protein